MARLALTMHVKFRRLAVAVGSKTLARGILETLWEPCWQAGDGYCGTSEDIEVLCEWKGERGALTKALLTAGGERAGFIEPFVGRLQANPREQTYQIHDFLEHCPEYVRRRHISITTQHILKDCSVCGEEYASSTSKSRFCSDRCRQVAHREGENPDSNGSVTIRNAPSRALIQSNLIKEKTLSNTTSELRSEALAVMDAPGLETDEEDDDTELPYQPSPLDSTSGAENDEPTPPPEPPAEPVLTFPTVGKAGPIWHLREDQLADWQALYPHFDVLEVARQALAWVRANPTKRKTAGGMPKFLVAWFNRTVDTPRTRGSPAPEALEPATDWNAFLAACPHTPKCDGIWRCDQLRRLAAVKGGG